MEKFLIRLFWIGGTILITLAVLSFYVRFQTLKYDLRAERGDALDIRE